MIDHVMKADNFDFWVAYELLSGEPCGSYNK